MALYDFRGRISVDYRFMNDGTFIIPGTNMTIDGELLFEFRDHVIPVYLLTCDIGEKLKTNTFKVVNVTLTCANNVDPGKELKVLIDIPDGFTLINHKSNEGIYSPSLGIWFVTLEDQTATLNLILEPITVGSGTFTVELDGTEVINETEYTIASTDSDGNIASHEISLSAPPESYSGSVGDGEDGTTTGYTAVNNISYTNLLDLDVSECSNAAKFHPNQGTETIVDWTSVEYAERNGKSVIVSCPGTNNDEGTYITITGLTVGEVHTVAVCAYALAGTELAIYPVGLDSYGTFSPAGFVNEKRIKFTATATSHDIAIHLTSKIAEDFSVALLMVAEGDIGNAPIVLPGETGNTVRIQNIEEVTDQMRVVYSGYGMEFTDADIDELVSIGTTDFIHLAYFNITDNYASKKAVIDEYATRFKNKGINFHAAFSAFVHQDTSQEDPTDSTYVSLLVSTIEDLITDCPDLAGISFDDFNYPSTYHVLANEATEETTLKNFITTITTAVHAIRSTAKVSGALMPVPGDQGNNLTYFSDEFDFSILMCTYRFKNNVSTYIRDRLEPTLEYTGDNLVIPAVLNFYSDSSPNDYLPVELLISDIYDILDLNPQGYAIFDWDRHPEGLYCPIEDANSGNNSIRVRTYGVTANEGMKLSVPDIQIRSGFNGILAIKTDNNLDYLSGYGVNRLESFTGSGEWDTVPINQTASEKYLYVETNGIQKTTLHIDKFTFALELTNTYNAFLSNLKDGELYTVISYSKVEESTVTGIHEGIKNNRLSVVNGTEYLGSRVLIQNNIEKVICAFIYDSTEEISIKRYYQYESIASAFTDRFYGLCINEGLNFEYTESKNLLSNPDALLDDTGYSELILPGASESAEYQYNIPVSDLTSALSFFNGLQLSLNSFGQNNSGIEIIINSSTGTESATQSGYINRTGKITIGQMGELWDLDSLDIEGKTLSVRVKFSNGTTNSQTFSYNNLGLTLYYIEDETGGVEGFTAKDVHSMNYQLLLLEVELPEGPEKEISTISLPFSDGEVIVSYSLKAKTIKAKFVVWGDTLTEAKEKLRAINRWLNNERNTLSIPIPYTVIFDFQPDMAYNVVLSGPIDTTVKYASIECEATFTVESGVALTSTSKITGRVGSNEGIKKVRPIVTIMADGSSTLTVTESNSNQLVKINNPITQGTVLTVDCENRTVTDEDGTDYTEDVDITSVWFNLSGEYNFTVNGCVFQSIEYYEGY